LTTESCGATLPLVLLILKTALRRLALPVLVLLVWAPAAQAWSWPVAGPVLQPFSYDEAHPYAAGQHRGIDIGADAAGEPVVAPAAGVVSFAGTVPTSGRSVTIETADGYAVTLTHLGSIAVLKGARVAEGDPVGAVGPTGEPEVAGPYVHLGIRVAGDPNGYVDPLGLLPPTPGSGASDSGSGASQPSSGGASSTVPTSEPAPPATATAASPSAAPAHGSTASHGRGSTADRRHQRAQESRAEPRVSASSQRPTAADVGASHHAAAPRIHVSSPASSSWRPVVETPAAREEPTGLGAGHEIPAGARAERPEAPSAGLFPLLSNGVAALVALGAALAAGRRRRRGVGSSPIAVAEVLHLPLSQTDRRRAA
jgi:Peptidase family M23